MRKLAALAVTVALVLLATLNAVATDTNHVDHWCETGGIKIEPIEPPSPSFTVPAPPEGKVWTLLVIKAGSGPDQNTVIENPNVGTTYFWATGDKDISHVILCYEPGRTTTTTTVEETTTTSTPTTTTTTSPEETTTTSPSTTSTIPETTTTDPGETTTTSQPVTTSTVATTLTEDTLPFTGAESTDLALIGLSLLGAGTLALVAMRKPDEE